MYHLYIANWVIICYRSHLLRERGNSIDIACEASGIEITGGTRRWFDLGVGEEVTWRVVFVVFFFGGRKICALLPGKLTWNLKIHQLKSKIIFKTIIFRFHVNLPGCIFVVWSIWILYVDMIWYDMMYAVSCRLDVCFCIQTWGSK